MANKEGKETAVETAGKLASPRMSVEDLTIRNGKDGKTEEEIWDWRKAMSVGWQLTAKKMMEQWQEELKNGKSQNGQHLNAMEILDRVMQYRMMQSMFLGDGGIFGDGNHTKPNDPELEKLKKDLEEEKERRKKLEEAIEREKEKKEILDAIDKKIAPLKEVIDGSLKEKEEEKPIFKKLEEVNKKLEEKEMSAKEAEQRRLFDDLTSRIDALNAEITKHEKDKDKNKGGIEDFIRQAEEIEKLKTSLARSLGMSTEKAEKASVTDVIREVSQTIPDIARGVSDMRRAFSNDEYPDEPMPQSPPNFDMPVRNVPVKDESLNPKIAEFLKHCHEENGQLIDPEGIGWTTPDGMPLSIEQVKSIALVSPDAVLDRIRDIPLVQRKERQANPPVHENKKTDSFPQQQPDEDIQDEEDYTEETGETEATEEKTTKKTENDGEKNKTEKNNGSKEIEKAKSYIGSLKEVKTDDGKSLYIGEDGEYYLSNSGEPLSREDLVREAEADPKGFLETVENAKRLAKEQKEKEKNE